MKRTLFLIATFAMFIGFTSCELDLDESTSSKVKITVKNENGDIQVNKTVYMFKKPSSEKFGKDPVFAKRTSVTNSKGIANFELKEDIDLDEVNSQTTLYFTILSKSSSGQYSVEGTVGLTVKNGDNASKILILKN